MHLIRIDPHNRSIFFVQLSDLPRVAPMKDDVVVDLVPERENSGVWAGDVADGGVVEAREEQVEDVDEEDKWEERGEEREGKCGHG